MGKMHPFWPLKHTRFYIMILSDFNDIKDKKTQNPYRCHNPDNSHPTLLTKLWADLEDSLHFRPEK